MYHIYNTHTVAVVVLQMYSLEMDTEAVFALVSRHGVLILYQHTHFPVFWCSFMGNREIKRIDEQPDATFPCCPKRIEEWYRTGRLGTFYFKGCLGCKDLRT